MEFLNEAAFEEEYGSQESWLSRTPGAKKYVPFFDLQTQTQCLQAQTQGLQVVQGSQVIPRSAAASLGGFPLIIPAKPKKNAPLPPSAAGTATPGGHTPFSGIPPPGHTPFSGIPPPRHTPFSGIPPPEHTPLSGIPPPPLPLASANSKADSQPAHVYMQLGVERVVHLDYLLFS
jgi:hypothetical protein